MTIAAHPSETKRAADLREIECIGTFFADRLASLGLKTTDDLLTSGGTRADRVKLAEATGLTPERVLDWVNRADIYRISGVECEDMDLLRMAGVDTVTELSRRTAASLVATFVHVFDEHPGIARRLPTETEVAGWIEQAQHLPRVVEY